MSKKSEKAAAEGSMSAEPEVAAEAPPAPEVPYPMNVPHQALPTAADLGLPEVVTLYPLSGFAAITLDGVTYTAGADGTVKIPRDHVETAKSHFLSDKPQAAPDASAGG